MVNFLISYRAPLAPLCVKGRGKSAPSFNTEANDVFYEAILRRYIFSYAIGDIYPIVE